MAEVAVGKDIMAYCGKCEGGRWHVIVSMLDIKTVAKVQCNTCKGQHKFKDPTMATTAKKSTATKATKSKVKAANMSVADLWMQEMSNAARKSQPYSIRAKFSAGDIIDHTSFGPGIVQSVKDDRIEVVFRDEIKNLVHNK